MYGANILEPVISVFLPRISLSNSTSVFLFETIEKHMAEAYIVSYADSIDAYIENIISYPRNAFNPLNNEYYYESENPTKYE